VVAVVPSMLAGVFLALKAAVKITMAASAEMTSTTNQAEAVAGRALVRTVSDMASA
jgi:hypothetical protein